MLKRTTLVASFTILAACGKLPAVQTDAFSKVAQADRTAFGAAQASRKAALQALSINQLTSGSGTLAYIDCSPVAPVPALPASAAQPVCANSLVAGGNSFVSKENAPETNKLIGAIANYGARMAELAAAKDLTDLNSRIDGAAAAIAAIGAASGVGAPAGPIAKLIALGVEGGFKEKRRQMLLNAAVLAKPAIDKAAMILTGEAKAIQNEVASLAGPRLTTAQLEVPQDVIKLRAVDQSLVMASAATGPGADERRQQLYSQRTVLQQRISYLVNDQFAATAQVQASREMTTDFTSLTKGHDAIIASLKPGKADLATSFTELNAFLGDLKDLKAAL